MRLKILIYTTQENIDNWILKMMKSFIFDRKIIKYNEIILENDLVYIILRTEISESIRGYRWNYVILDAPIKREILDSCIEPKIITKNYTENFKIIK